MRLKAMLAVTLAGMGLWHGSLHGQVVRLVFHGEPGFESAVEEYQEIWAAEAESVVEVLERLSGLTFNVDTVTVEVMEGPSWAGTSTMGMRASYSADTKRATLVHELGHILIGDLIPEDAPPRTTPEPHYVLFLFLYDVWVELWGTDFADAQVGVESARRGRVDYEGTWQAVRSKTSSDRSTELREIITNYSRPR